MTLNQTLKTLKSIYSDIQYSYYPNHQNPKFKQSIIIRIPNNKHQDTIAETLYKTLYDNLKIPYYWHPRQNCLFCVVVPHVYN